MLKEKNGSPIQDENFTKPKYTTIDAKHFEPVVEGMHQVYTQGTASASQVKGIEICGKTGTAENYTRINESVCS